MIFHDQLGRVVDIPHPPQKIISTVPSQTELLFDLGLGDKVVGVTWFCERPAKKVKQVQKIGGTKKLKINKILSLEPDLVIANKEENEQEQIGKLAQQVPVWVSDVSDLTSALEMIRQVGKICGREEEAMVLAGKIETGFAELKPKHTKRAAYFIWRKPWMTVGRDTFINDIMERVGYKNIYRKQTRYPETNLTELKELAPEVVLLSSEPYPFKHRHVEEVQKIVPSAEVVLVDGQIFSWYGSRLLESVKALQEINSKDGNLTSQ